MSEIYNKRTDVTCEIVSDLYLKGYSSIAIAKELNVSKKLVLRRLKEAGVETRKSNTYEEITEVVLNQLYVVERLSTRDIASKFGCSNNLISKRLARYGIEARPNVDPDLSVEERKSKYGRSGENHGLWKGGTTSVTGLIRNRLAYVSKERMKLDGYTCITCGRNRGTIHAHHKRRFSEIIQEILAENPEINLLNDESRFDFAAICEKDARLTDISNLETLCEPCHIGQHHDETFEPIQYAILEKEWRDYIRTVHTIKSVSEMSLEINVRPYRIIDFMKDDGLSFAYENKDWLTEKLEGTNCATVAKEFNSLRHRVFAADIRKYAYQFGLVKYKEHGLDAKALH